VRLILTLLSLSLACRAQSVVVGAAGGLRVTGDAPTYGSTNSKRYSVGPKVELGLPFRFGLEVDLLYSRLGNTAYVPLIGNAAFIRTIADAWAVPVLVKYRLPVARVHPFASGGIAPRHTGGIVNTIQYGFVPGDVRFYSEDLRARDHAWVLGGGTELRFGKIRIAPELRYLRWQAPSGGWVSHDAGSYFVPRNEAQVLLGIGWSVR
jgi:hypothetical protein